jgi:hypothetical protein
VPDGDQFGELLVGLPPGVVATAAVGLVEQLREALGAPAIEDVQVHRGHPPSLVTESPAPLPAVATEPVSRRPTTGRTRTNARRAGPVTGVSWAAGPTEIDIR